MHSEYNMYDWRLLFWYQPKTFYSMVKGCMINWSLWGVLADQISAEFFTKYCSAYWSPSSLYSSRYYWSNHRSTWFYLLTHGPSPAKSDRELCTVLIDRWPVWFNTSASPPHCPSFSHSPCHHHNYSLSSSHKCSKPPTALKSVFVSFSKIQPSYQASYKNLPAVISIVSSCALTFWQEQHWQCKYKIANMHI